MRDFVVDANVLISMMISGKSSYKPVLSFFNFNTPQFAFAEIEKYADSIFEKSKLNAPELKRFTFFIFNHVSVIPRLVISSEAIEKATELTHDVDIKDLSYVALAIELDCVLLTRDKPLINTLKKKGFRKVMAFEDFLITL
ncbi:MAG: DNA-binding protein [Bacteroidetes bacterium]|nr:DNA-binding protein [Bacteroidota bacterium]